VYVPDTRVKHLLGSVGPAAVEACLIPIGIWFLGFVMKFCKLRSSVVGREKSAASDTCSSNPCAGLLALSKLRNISAILADILIL
jgi:hypothetical protein